MYAYGPAPSAGTLAGLLQRAGAVEAMQLDIDPFRMSFEYYQAHGHPAGPVPVNLLPTQQQSAYLSVAALYSALLKHIPVIELVFVASGFLLRALFTVAMGRFEQVPFIKLAAGDTADAWSAALPSALGWLWRQLAPPDLRARFPVRGYGHSFTVLPDPAGVQPPAHRFLGWRLRLA